MMADKVKGMHVREAAKRLFSDELEADPKTFYEKYREDSSVYHELTKRIAQKVLVVSVDINPEVVGLGAENLILASFVSVARGYNGQPLIDHAAYRITDESIHADSAGGYSIFDKLVATYEAVQQGNE